MMYVCVRISRGQQISFAEKRCPEGYQVQTFCRNGEACPGGMDCIDGSCCPVPLNSGPGIHKYSMSHH